MSVEILEELVDSLPTYFPKDEESENYKIFGAISEEVEKIEDGLDEIEVNTRVTDADSIEGIRKLGQIVNITPRSNEYIEHYRTRVIVTYQNITNEASISDLINSISFILEIGRSNINIQESNEAGLIVLAIPQAAINNSPLEVDEFIEIVSDNVAAGYRIEIISSGTFTYISPEDYDQNNHNPDFGYASLSTEGEPEGGGTYSTILK